jgi:PadR family transcriptional regulator, regulatory protein PadR
MLKPFYLGEFEQLVLLAVLRLGEGAYGVTICGEIEERTGRVVARGAVYITLERMEKKGYLRSWYADPTPERGGRAKRYYKLEKAGLAALKDSLERISRMSEGLEPILGKA